MRERLPMPADPNHWRWALCLHIAYDVVHADAVLQAWREALAAEPEALDAEARVRPLPNKPHVPPGLRGREAVVVDGTYRGHLQDGYALLRRLRTIATPLIDRTAPVDVR